MGDVVRGNGFTIASVFNDEAVIERYLRASVRMLPGPVNVLEIDNVGNALTTNIASLYNTVLGISGPDIVAFLHPDITFDAHFVDRVSGAIEALERVGTKWGALGIVGRSWSGDYLWGHDVDEPAPVCCLDSCSLITRRSLGVRFDQRRFGEFHCYVEDYCLQVQDRGYTVQVVPVTAHHASSTKNELGSQWGKYRWYRRRLGWKWNRRFGQIYTC